MLTGSLALALLCVAVVVIGGTAAVAVEAKYHFIGNALLDMKDSIVLLFKLGKAVVSPLMEELTEDIIEAQKKLALRTLQKDSQDIPGMISSIIGAIHSVTPIDIDLTIPPFSADIPKDIGVTIFPKPVLDIPEVESIPATERESNVIIENPPYIPKSIIDIFPEHVNEGETIIRMDGWNESDNDTVRNGATRAAQYASEWGEASLQEAINKFAPGVEPVVTSKGKVIYSNVETGISIVYDKNGNYFRIEDTARPRGRNYLDMDGNDMNNEIVNGKTRGRSKADYQRVTHFKNSDK